MHLLWGGSAFDKKKRKGIYILYFNFDQAFWQAKISAFPGTLQCKELLAEGKNMNMEFSGKRKWSSVIVDLPISDFGWREFKSFKVILARIQII